MQMLKPPAKKASLESTKDEAVSRECLLLSSKRATRSIIDGKKKDKLCFFCENAEKCIFLQQKELYAKVRHYASLLCDQKLLIKLAEGDKTAIDTTYHLRCLVNLCNRVR